MENQKSKIENQKFIRRYRGGFTMVELLIALMITGMLLAAIAFAFSASVKNFNDNREIFLAANKARQALTQIVPRLRTAYAVSSSSPANECAFFPNAVGPNVTYRYNSSDKKLYMIDTNGSHVLCDNVTAMTFTKNIGGGNVKSVIISMKVTEGSNSQTFSTAVVIRKNL
jgi:prepilin-type N-terminal cleavage/methylation domain-containing protein